MHSSFEIQEGDPGAGGLGYLRFCVKSLSLIKYVAKVFIAFLLQSLNKSTPSLSMPFSRTYYIRNNYFEEEDKELTNRDRDRDRDRDRVRDYEIILFCLFC